MQLRAKASNEATTERGLKALVWDGIFSQALGIFTGGTLLTGCALELGASPAFIGLLAAVPFFAQLAHIPAVVLIEKVRRRRMICLVATLAARLMLLPLAAVPFIADRDLSLALLLGAFAVLTPLGAIGGCAWMSWTCELVPHHRLGDVFGSRQLRSNVAAVVAGLLGGAIVNGWSRGFPGWHAGAYAVTFALAVAAALASTWCLTLMPEVPMPAPRHTRLRALFARPFRETNFRRVMLFLGCWQFVANLALPLFPVYLVKQLNYGITTAIALGMVSQLAMIAAVPLWGRVSDQWSNKTVIALAGPLFLCCPIGWTLAVVPAPHGLTLPILVLLQMLLGVALAGLDLGSGNIVLKLAPRHDSTVFLGANGLVKSLCAGCAAIIGGFLIDHLTALELPLLPVWAGSRILGLHPWSFFFLATALLGVFALMCLSHVEESGDVRLAIVFACARRRLAAALLPDAVSAGARSAMLDPRSARPSWRGMRRAPVGESRARRAHPTCFTSTAWPLQVKLELHHDGEPADAGERTRAGKAGPLRPASPAAVKFTAEIDLLAEGTRF
jgi:MFS family permease